MTRFYYYFLHLIEFLTNQVSEPTYIVFKANIKYLGNKNDLEELLLLTTYDVILSGNNLLFLKYLTVTVPKTKSKWIFLIRTLAVKGQKVGDVRVFSV